MSSHAQQLASICAVLGGFAVTFLSVVLTHPDERRRVAVTLALAAAAAAAFFVAALGWTLIAANERDFGFRPMLSLLFLTGTLLLFAVLGMSGWLRSRALGIATSVIAGVAGVLAIVVVQRFVR